MEKTKLFLSKVIFVLCIISGIVALVPNFFLGVLLILLGFIILPSTSIRILEILRISKIKNVRNIAIILLIVLVLISISINNNSSQKKAPNRIETKATNGQNNIKVATTEQLSDKAEIKENEKIIPTTTIKTVGTTTTATTINNDRNEMITIFKADALSKWKDDYQMVNYEIQKQTEAYDWILKYTKYTNILDKAKQEGNNDYSMVKYEYEKQSSAYEGISQQTAYPEIMKRAKQEWGSDYSMVKYEYEKQVEAYKNLQ